MERSRASSLWDFGMRAIDGMARMKNFIQANPNQPWLLPVDPREWVPTDELLLFILKAAEPVPASTQSNLTDPDSRLMRKLKGSEYRWSHNAQAAASANVSQLILDHWVSNCAADGGGLIADLESVPTLPGDLGGVMVDTNIMHRGSVAAISAFQGFPRVALYDNLRSAMLERRSEVIRFHPTLLDLSAYYRLQPRHLQISDCQRAASTPDPAFVAIQCLLRSLLGDGLGQAWARKKVPIQGRLPINHLRSPMF